MEDELTDTGLDAAALKALERFRELWAELRPLIAVVESLLEIPGEERYVSTEFIPGQDTSKHHAT